MAPISEGGHRLLAGARVSAKANHGGNTAKRSPAAAATVALQKFI